MSYTGLSLKANAELHEPPNAHYLMRNLRSTVIRNSFSNLVRGGASGVVALVLPHVLTRTLDSERFAAWALLLQVAAFAGYFESALQITVSRFLAQALARDERRGVNEIVSTSVALLTLLAMAAFAAILLFAGEVTILFPQLPTSLVAEFRMALLLMAGGSALTLPLSAFAGVLLGLHRNEFLALSVGGSRILGAVAVLLATRHTTSLVWLAGCIAGASALGSMTHIVFAYRLLPTLKLGAQRISKSVAGRLTSFSAALMTWSFAGILVSGLDLTVLAHYDFPSVGYYSVGAYLILFLAGLNAAMSGALMTPIAALHATGETDRIRALTISATRISTYTNLLLTIATLLFGRAALGIWVGPAYADAGVPILYVLMVANLIRLIPGPYASMLVATGQQKHGIAQGLAEGVVNLGASLFLVRHMGAIGVALGTLLGALVGVAWSTIFTMKWANDFVLSRSEYIREGTLRPLACLLPLLILVPVLQYNATASAAILYWSVALASSIVLTEKYGKLSRERVPASVLQM